MNLGNVRIYPTTPQPVTWPVLEGLPPTPASAFQPRKPVFDQVRAARGHGADVVLTNQPGRDQGPGRGAGVLTGGGGVGKTQLAAWLLHQILDDRTADLLVWVNAGSPEQIITAYARAAVRAAVPGADGKDSVADARALLQWLHTTDRRWLIVLDDITDPKHVNGWWPPQRPTGWTLATTRLRDVTLISAGRWQIDVDVYTPGEALAYLTDRLTQAKHPQLLDDQAPSLATALGHLPLALSHAAAYMIDQQIGCTRYLARYTAAATMAEVMPEDADPDGYGRSVTVTLLLALDAADKNPPAGLARPALALAAVLGPADYPDVLWHTSAVTDYLTKNSQHDVTSDLVRQTLRLLHRYGLITHTAGVVRIHALTARAAREDTTLDLALVTQAARSARLQLRGPYRRVDLEILMPLTEQGEHPVMLLDQVFVAQQVRADPPLVEIPREVWHRLAEAGQGEDAHLPEQIDQDELEAASRAYREQPCRSVLEVIAEPEGRKIVLLGDPGAGKSTLARYLLQMLAAASPRDLGGPLPAGLFGYLPLLVELRTYDDPGWWRAGREMTFLDLIDRLYAIEGIGFPRSVLEPFLDSGGPALVVFDGLDELFSPQLREQVTGQITAFAARYPQTRIVVTSRLVGYQRQLLDTAGFEHWMLQDLDASQVRAFTTGWYAQSCLDDSRQAIRLRDRLLAAIASSPAVAELAGNPMLLTILAIIGRRHELPRDRRRVYQHAVTVLIEHWDVNKHLRAEQITIDYQDKLELLQRVARHMQDAPVGLAGNHVPGPSLIDWFRDYLQERFALPADRAIPAARAMLAEFRERNFILARFGSDVYGFVHRTFLEYLAASDLSQRLLVLELTPEQVLAVYGQRWPDPAWTEVLLLLTGMIPDRLAIQAITQLLDADPHWRMCDRLPRHLLLALQAATEVRKTPTLAPVAPALTQTLIDLLEESATREDCFDRVLSDAIERLALHLAGVFGSSWPAADLYQRWYHQAIHRLGGTAPYTATRTAATIYIALTSHNLDTLRHNAVDPQWATREAAVRALAADWADNPGTLPLLRDATNDTNEYVRQAAAQAITVND